MGIAVPVLVGVLLLATLLCHFLYRRRQHSKTIRGALLSEAKVRLRRRSKQPLHTDGNDEVEMDATSQYGNDGELRAEIRRAKEDIGVEARFGRPDAPRGLVTTRFSAATAEMVTGRPEFAARALLAILTTSRYWPVSHRLCFICDCVLAQLVSSTSCGCRPTRHRRL